jgi:hypothetical protein
MFQSQELCNVEKDGTAIMHDEVQVMLPLSTPWRRIGGIAPRIPNIGSRYR